MELKMVGKIGLGQTRATRWGLWPAAARLFLDTNTSSTLE
jgi:hypothetical protein